MTRVSGIGVVHVRGDIDLREMGEIKKTIADLLLAGKTQVVLNLRLVDYINYFSIGILLQQQKVLMTAGGELKLAGVSPIVRRIFATVGMDQYFEDYATLEEAMESFDDDFSTAERPNA